MFIVPPFRVFSVTVHLKPKSPSEPWRARIMSMVQAVVLVEREVTKIELNRRYGAVRRQVWDRKNLSVAADLINCKLPIFCDWIAALRRELPFA